MVSRSRISWPLVIALRLIHRIFMTVYFRIVLRHPEHLPRRGPVILAPSHRSKWDAFVLTYLAGEPLHYLAAYQEFVGVQGWFMRHLGAFPINAETPTPGAIRHAIDLVVAGETLVVFPEGTIFYYRPDEVHPLKRGTAWMGLAAQDRCPDTLVQIVPIRLNYGDRFLRFRSRIEVVVQEPIAVAPYLAYPRKEGTRILTADLQKSLGDTVNTSLKERYSSEDSRDHAYGEATADPQSNSPIEAHPTQTSD